MMNGTMDAAATGRRAFWDGKALWANPFTGGDAERWKTGWLMARTMFGAGTVTAAALAALRPADLPVGKPAVARRMGAGGKLAGARRAAALAKAKMRTPRPWEVDL